MRDSAPQSNTREQTSDPFRYVRIRCWRVHVGRLQNKMWRVMMLPD